MGTESSKPEGAAAPAPAAGAAEVSVEVEEPSSPTRRLSEAADAVAAPRAYPRESAARLGARRAAAVRASSGVSRWARP